MLLSQVVSRQELPYYLLLSQRDSGTLRQVLMNQLSSNLDRESQIHFISSPMRRIQKTIYLQFQDCHDLIDTTFGLI